MSRVYVTADWHLGHRNILKYRPQFSTIEEHDQTLISNYNSCITKRDTVYFLGDICFTHEAIEQIKPLLGHKVLVLGNHDMEHEGSLEDLSKCFDKIISLTARKGFWMSHAPIHSDELRGKFNIHGHTHNHSIRDYRYVNVSVENTGYFPINRDVIKTITGAGLVFNGRDYKKLIRLTAALDAEAKLTEKVYKITSRNNIEIIVGTLLPQNKLIPDRSSGYVHYIKTASKLRSFSALVYTIEETT